MPESAQVATLNNEDFARESRELPEPAAWRVYFPDEQREEFASSLDDLLDDLTNCAHDDPEPLYTADQMREAIASGTTTELSRRPKGGRLE